MSALLLDYSKKENPAGIMSTRMDLMHQKTSLNIKLAITATRRRGVESDEATTNRFLG